MVPRTIQRAVVSDIWRDRAFHIAVLAGPLCWLILYIYFQPDLHLISSLSGWKVYFTVSLLYPVVEELVFRGVLQGYLYRFQVCQSRVLGLSKANIITASVFVLAHLINHDTVWALLILFPALIFGFFRDKYKSVTPAIILHCLYNSGYFLIFTPI